MCGWESVTWRETWAGLYLFRAQEGGRWTGSSDNVTSLGQVSADVEAAVLAGFHQRHVEPHGGWGCEVQLRFAETSRAAPAFACAPSWALALSSAVTVHARMPNPPRRYTHQSPLFPACWHSQCRTAWHPEAGFRFRPARPHVNGHAARHPSNQAHDHVSGPSSDFLERGWPLHPTAPSPMIDVTPVCCDMEALVARRRPLHRCSGMHETLGWWYSNALVDRQASPSATQPAATGGWGFGGWHGTMIAAKCHHLD